MAEKRKYEPLKIEKKWQEIWDKNDEFEVGENVIVPFRNIKKTSICRWYKKIFNKTYEQFYRLRGLNNPPALRRLEEAHKYVEEILNG